MLPTRPFTRAKGRLDSIVAAGKPAHIPNEITTGIPVYATGWLVDEHNAPIVAAWISIRDLTVPLELNRTRPDVAAALTLSNRPGPLFGFETLLELPADLKPGTYDVFAIGSTRRETGVYAEHSRRIRVAHPRCEAKPEIRAGDAPPAWFHISDTLAARHTLGRGNHTLREESSLHITGRVQDAGRVQVTARSQCGDVEAWTISCECNGTFDALLWIGGLRRGLYYLSIGRDNGATITPAAECIVEIAGPHLVQPSHLSKMRTAPQFKLTAYRDAGVVPIAAPVSGFIAGRPIAVSGWCTDPASGTPPLAICAEIDGARPIPLSFNLPRRQSSDETESLWSGFGGIIDTERLEPGEHTIQILAAAVSGAGWYVIDSRRVTLSNHRAVPETA